MSLTAEQRRHLDWIRVQAVSFLIGMLLGSIFASDFLMGVFLGMPRSHDAFRWDIFRNYSTYHFILKWVFVAIVMKIGWDIQRRYQELLNIRFHHRIIFHQVRLFVITPDDNSKRDYLWSFISTVAQTTLPFFGGCLALLFFPGLTSTFNFPVDIGSLIAGGFFVWLLMVTAPLPWLAPWYIGYIGLAGLAILLTSFQGTGGAFLVGIFLCAIFFAGVAVTDVLISIFFFSSELLEELKNAPFFVPYLLRLLEEQKTNRRK